MLKRIGNPQLPRRIEVYQAITITEAINARCISFQEF
jgi:hypothetical protein